MAEEAKSHRPGTHVRVRRGPAPKKHAGGMPVSLTERSGDSLGLPAPGADHHDQGAVANSGFFLNFLLPLGYLALLNLQGLHCKRAPKAAPSRCQISRQNTWQCTLIPSRCPRILVHQLIVFVAQEVFCTRKQSWWAARLRSIRAGMQEQHATLHLAWW